MSDTPATQLGMFDRIKPLERPPADKDQHIAQLLKVNSQQAAQIRMLTTSGRKLTQAELAAIVHVLATPGHKDASCPPLSGKTCPHLRDTREGLSKLKGAIRARDVKKDSGPAS